MTAGWSETEVLMDVSTRRLAPVQHRHLPARGLLSVFSLLRAFLLNAIKRNHEHKKNGDFWHNLRTFISVRRCSEG